MKVLLIGIGMLLSLSLNAQNGVDSLYEAGKVAAKAGNYDTAKEKLEDFLRVRSGDYDATVLLARVYYWQGKPLKALEIVESILNQASNDSETQLFLLDLLLATKQEERLLAYFMTLPSAMQKKPAFQFCRIKAWYQLERHEEALTALQSYLVSFPENQQARQLEQQLIRLLAKQAILLDLDFSSFNVPLDNWYSLAIGYENRLKQGPLQFRLHSAQRFQQTAFQLESDFYPTLNNKTTAYFGLGISNNTLFPGFRLGAELYRSLPSAWEVSAGLRYLSFRNNPLTTYTFSTTKYIGSYYINLRPFIIPFQGSVYLTSSLSARRYFKDVRHYLGLAVAVGNSPDMDFRLNDPNIEALNPDLYLLDAFSLRLDYQKPFGNRFVAKPFLEYRNEEFQAGNYRSRSSLGISLIRNF